MKILKLLCLIVMISLYACSKGPQPINYGEDLCHYCQMTIVDRIYGAELVNDKGKAFKFDAVECLVRYQNELEDTEGFKFYTNYFGVPEAFVAVEDASFLISKNLPSPMGEFLTAFDSQAKAEELKNEKGGEIYNWDDLIKLPQFND